MRFLCILASVCLVASGLAIAPNPKNAQPYTAQCGGWHGSFQVVYPSITEPRTFISSYNDGQGNYANNEECFIQFSTDDQPFNLRFRFTNFDVENALSCSYDALCLNGFDHCGHTLAGRTVSYSVPANSTFTVIFTSDSSVNKGGFYAIVDAVPYQSQFSDDEYQDYCLNQYNEPSSTPLYDTDFPDYSTPATEPIYDYPSRSDDTVYDYSQTTEDYFNYGSNDYSEGDYSNGDYSNGDYSYDRFPAPGK